MKMGRPPKYKTGDTFGFWTVINHTSGNGPQYLCQCICGGKQMLRLSKGMDSRSCGCKRGELMQYTYAGKRKKGIFNWAKTHGLSGTREYISWKHAVNRCGNPKNDGYHLYGGRGIRVCSRWLGPEGLNNFLIDMGPRPPKTSLDRINPDGDYEPTNCRWADDKTQIKNRRVVVQVSLARLRELEALENSLRAIV